MTNGYIKQYLWICVYTQVSIHIYILHYQLRRPKGKDTPGATSIPSTQILVLGTILQKKKVRFLGEMTNSRTGARNNELLSNKVRLCWIVTQSIK